MVATLDHNHATGLDQHQGGASGDLGQQASSNTDSNGSKGSSIQANDFKEALSSADHASSGHDHTITSASPVLPSTTDGKYTQVNAKEGQKTFTGGAGNDFLNGSAGKVSFNTAHGDGKTEFPFPTNSPGNADVNLNLSQDGKTLNVDGKFQDFQGKPLFSQGETTIDPNATVLGGKKAQDLVDGFLKTQNDAEGNTLTGAHLHFSPSGDDRNGDGKTGGKADDHADGTVVRFLDVKNDTASSGTVSGKFDLKPEETAALVAGNIYTNVHSNISAANDGKGGVPTGEARVNFNKNVVNVAA